MDLCRPCLCRSMIVRVDTVFTEPGQLEGLASRRGHHIA